MGACAPRLNALDRHPAQTKLRLIEIYNARLTERERRRQFILDRGLLNVKSQQVSARALTTTPRSPCAIKGVNSPARGSILQSQARRACRWVCSPEIWRTAVCSRMMLCCPCLSSCRYGLQSTRGHSCAPHTSWAPYVNSSNAAAGGRKATAAGREGAARAHARLCALHAAGGARRPRRCPRPPAAPPAPHPGALNVDLPFPWLAFNVSNVYTAPQEYG